LQAEWFRHQTLWQPIFSLTAGRGLSPDRWIADGDTPAALIVIRALPYTEPTALMEALPIGLGTHMAAGDTFADCLSRLYGDYLRDVPADQSQAS
jgi:hypothetical protein